MKIKLKSLLQLGRLNKPIGIWLLWAPTAWALWLSNQGQPPFRLVILFFLGTLIMRTAGCVMNDIADRHIDLHVQRTARRPLASGQLSLREALIFLIFLLSLAFCILVALGMHCFF